MGAAIERLRRGAEVEVDEKGRARRYLHLREQGDRRLSQRRCVCGSLVAHRASYNTVPTNMRTVVMKGPDRLEIDHQCATKGTAAPASAGTRQQTEKAVAGERGSAAHGQTGGGPEIVYLKKRLRAIVYEW